MRLCDRRFRMQIGLAALAATLMATAACGSAEPPHNESVIERPVSGAVTMGILNRTSRSLVAPVSATDLASKPRFVVVEIDEVENPDLVPLSFIVGFRPSEGPDLMLGTFSLYPANQPGRFIVAAQQKVRPGGQIFVKFSDDVSKLERVRVSIASLMLGQR